MDISLSYNWLKEYLDILETPEDFARQVSLCGVGVERLHPQAEKYNQIFVGQIKEILPHPNADRLKLVRVDVGDKLVDVVCGGTNLQVGMLVPVALAGAKVRWHGEGDLVEMKDAEIRGVKSFGMICAADEIGLQAAFPHAHGEIMDMTRLKLKAGLSLATALDLADTILDIEVTTNRIDAFSVLGVAREAATILETKLSTEAKRILNLKLPKLFGKENLKISVKAPKLCTRYIGAKLENITVEPSPWWLQKRLIASGIKPINNVVDITNYVMLEIGQPLHAFDASTVAGGIVVRQAVQGETLKTLDGKDHVFSGSELVIADSTKPLAVAGVIGGVDSSITSNATSIILEAASFNALSIRKTARLLSIRTDAVTRFEKGLVEEFAELAMVRALELFADLTDAKVVAMNETANKKSVSKTFILNPAQVQKEIGVSIPETKMVKVLTNLGFILTKKGKNYAVKVPYFRRLDIETDRDFTEEIARIYGYHNLPAVMPSGMLPGAVEDTIFAVEERTKKYFEDLGFLETINYSFISQSDVEKSGRSLDGLLSVNNPLTADFVYMRPSLIPGAMNVIKNNQGLYPAGNFFELSNVYDAKHGNSDLPDEITKLLIVKYSRDNQEQLFREIKGIAENYLALMSVDYKFERDVNGGDWHAGAHALIRSGETEIGQVGVINPLLIQNFGIDVNVVAVELDIRKTMLARNNDAKYKAVPLYPPVLRDLALIVDESLEYADLELTILGSSDLLKTVELFDLYRSANLGSDKKSLAIHLKFAHQSRTLTAEEIDQEMQKIVENVRRIHGGEVRV